MSEQAAEMNEVLCLSCGWPVKNVGPDCLSRGADRWLHVTPVPAYYSHIAEPSTATGQASA